MSFKQQLENSNDSMIAMIKNYLLSRNDTSNLLEKENKNIDDMMLFIGHELYVKYLEGKSNQRMACVTGPDEELYGIVMHYLDEDNIDMNAIKKKMENIMLMHPGNANDDEKENSKMQLLQMQCDAYKQEIEKMKQETKPKRTAKKKKSKVNDMQLGFDL
jgi:hypothetical protein